jgi:hypothetical protein
VPSGTWVSCKTAVFAAGKIERFKQQSIGLKWFDSIKESCLPAANFLEEKNECV